METKQETNIDSAKQAAIRLALAHDHASSNLELVDYFVRDIGISVTDAWRMVRQRHQASIDTALR